MRQVKHHVHSRRHEALLLPKVSHVPGLDAAVDDRLIERGVTDRLTTETGAADDDMERSDARESDSVETEVIVRVVTIGRNEKMSQRKSIRTSALNSSVSNTHTPSQRHSRKALM